MIDKPEEGLQDNEQVGHEVPEWQKKAYEEMFGQPWYPGAERFVDTPPIVIIRDSES